jgi:ubiquinone/menaquinone biosynthesis C-methylase UbiE
MQIARHEQFLGVLRENGFYATPPDRIMDLGCGAGNLVMEFKVAGYDAYGCDLVFKEGPHVDSLSRDGRIRLIDRNSYRLPFDSGMFDVVISDQVFEHVQDYGAALQEIRRILKPNGISVHFFPSRYMLIEPTLVQSYWWLRLWAGLGVRMITQRSMGAYAVAKDNHRYLTSSTNYLPKKKINQEFLRFFKNVEFAEQSFLKYSRSGQWVYRLSCAIPFIAAIYSTLGTRVIVVSGPRLP